MLHASHLPRTVDSGIDFRENIQCVIERTDALLDFLSIFFSNASSDVYLGTMPPIVPMWWIDRQTEKQTDDGTPDII